MDPIYKERGGLWISYGFGRLQATWPFAVIEFYKGNLLIKLDFESTFSKIVFPFYLFGRVLKLNKKYLISYKEIDFIEKRSYVPFWADGIQIHHHAKVPNYILFWSFKSTQHLIDLFKKQKIKIQK